MKISEFRLRHSGVSFSTQNAWASYVRNRWPTKTQANVEAEWDLSPGRANGVVFANITQRTIDAILDHPRGGASVALTVLAIRLDTDVEGLVARFVQQERREIADARRQLDAAEDRARGAWSRLRSRGTVDDPAHRLVDPQAAETSGDLGSGRGRQDHFED